MRRGPAVFLLVCLLLGAAYGAWRAGQEGYDRLMRYAPTPVEESPSVGAAPLAHRLILIPIDRLGLEDARLLPSLDWLSRRGASYWLSTPAPGDAEVAMASLLTGASPAVHGDMGFTAGRKVEADDLYRAAQRAELTSVEAVLGADLQDLLRQDGPQLFVLHTEPLEGKNRAALTELDRKLVTLFEQIDWSETAVVVTGLTLPDAASGARLPLVMAGSGIRAEVRGEGSLLDVAPTLAALLGMATPAHAEGVPLLDAFAVEERPKDAITERYLSVRRAQASAVLQRLGSDQVPPEAPTTAAEAEPYLAALAAQVKAASLEWTKAGVLERLPYVGGGALLLLLSLLLVYVLPTGRAALAGQIVYGLVFHALFFLTGGSYQEPVPNLESPPALLVRFGPMVGAALVAAALCSGLLLSRVEFRRKRALPASALYVALSLVAAVALPAVVLVLVLGWEFPARLPALGLWVWFFLTAVQVVLLGGLGPIAAWVMVRTAQYGRRRWPPKEIGDPERNADKVVRLRAIRRARRHGARA